MPKPIKERDTSNPLGQKINQVMREKGMGGDYGALARAFTVKTPSVYDWIDHGRLGKERYNTLVAWSGRSLDWWFDVVSPVTMTIEMGNSERSIALIAAESRQEYIAIRTSRNKSPFERVSQADWEALPPEAICEIETFVLGLIAGRRSAADVKRQNGNS